MLPRVPIPPRLSRALRTPLPFATRPLPIRDPAPDAGLFGPGSVTWRVMREPVLMLGAGRALLMQAANPLVAQGAIDHSTYATDPFGRFERTIEWVTKVSFGTTAEAERVSRGVTSLHRRVTGSLPAVHATGTTRPGSSYSGTDPLLLRWVHASFVDTMLATHDALVGGLDEGARDQFVREWNTVAALMGVPGPLRFRSAGQLRRYVEREVAGGRAKPGEGSRAVARTVLHPPVGSPLARQGMDLMAFMATGLLPAKVREGYGIEWTVRHRAAHRAACLWLRSVRPALPRRLRVSPVYDRALARSEGRWPLHQAA